MQKADFIYLFFALEQKAEFSRACIPPWTETVCKAQMIMRTARNKARKDIFAISAAALWACVGVTCVTVCAALCACVGVTLSLCVLHSELVWSCVGETSVCWG